MTRGVTALLLTIGVLGGAAYYFFARHSSVQRAGQAIARASEYSIKDDSMWEPRYLEAEKAVAEVLPGDSLVVAKLDLCLTTVKLSHDLRVISSEAGYLMVRAKANGDGPKQIAESSAWATEARDKYLKQYEKSLKCVDEITE